VGPKRPGSGFSQKPETEGGKEQKHPARQEPAKLIPVKGGGAAPSRRLKHQRKAERPERRKIKTKGRGGKKKALGHGGSKKGGRIWLKTSSTNKKNVCIK